MSPWLVQAQSGDEVHVSPRSDSGVRRVAEVASNTATPPLRPRPLRHDVDLVLVPVTVTDPFNRLVTDLDKHDFSVAEAGSPQQIRYFSVEDAPISLGVILDISASMKDKIDDAREAVVQFFANSNPNDDYFVITFSDQPQLLADSTRSIGSIRERIVRAQPHGYTALLDAIYLGIHKMRHAHYGRRALLVISDGGDNASRYTEEEIKRIVEEADVTIYSVGIFSHGIPMLFSPVERHGRDLLANISDVTGGRLIELHNSRELPGIAQQVSLELRSQYVLGYRPQSTTRDGQWRKIKVSLSSSHGGDLHVYSKKGYLAPQD